MQWRQRREIPRVYIEPVSIEDIMRTYNEIRDDHLKRHQNISKVQKEQNQLREVDDGVEYAIQGELLGSSVHDEVRKDLAIVRKDYDLEEENTSESE